MLMRELGDTGIMVSPIGLGTVKFGRNTQVKYPHAFVIPSDREIATLLGIAHDRNINLLDTAPAYGNSEVRLGNALKNQRHHWVLASKVGEYYTNQQSHFDFSAKSIERSIHQSLKALQTDYIDILLVHSDGEHEAQLADACFPVLEKAKQKGMIRSFGMSSKTIAGGLASIQQADLVMATYNADQHEEKVVLDRALELKKGVLLKKVLGSGHFKGVKAVHPLKYALDFALGHDATTSVVLGTINPLHLIENIDIVEGITGSW